MWRLFFGLFVEALARTRTHNTCLHTHTPVCVFTGEFGKIGHESLTMLAVSPFPISFESDVFRLPTVLLLFKFMVEWVCKIWIQLFEMFCITALVLDHSWRHYRIKPLAEFSKEFLEKFTK